MAEERNTRNSGAPDDNRVRHIKLGVVIAIIILAAVVAAVVMERRSQNASPADSGQEVSADNGELEIEIEGQTLPDNGEAAGEGETDTERASASMDSEETDSSETSDDNETDGTAETTAFSSEELQKDSVPQVNQMISEYFQAKVDQDADTLYRLFGKTDTSDIDRQKKLLKAERAYVEDYEDIVCYTEPGMTEDSYLTYVTYKVKFYRVKTLAPGLMWCYILKDENGNYIIRENVVGAEADFVAKANQSEEVRRLQKTIDEQLRQALESDELLAGYYQELQGGAVVDHSDESDAAPDSAVELVE